MKAASPTCPRCGYDQSGAIAAWERDEPPQCPVAGVCSECGLEFLWRELLNPAFREQVRLFEHARRRRLGSFFLTLRGGSRPWVFWRWVRMEHEIVWERLLAFSAGGAMLMYLLAAGFAAGLSYAMGLVLSTGPSASSFGWLLEDMLRLVLWPMGRVDSWSSGIRWWERLDVSPFIVLPVGAFFIMPLTFALLPVTLRAASVRRGHTVRIWLYGLVWLPLTLFLPTLVRLAASLVWAIDFTWVRGRGAGYGPDFVGIIRHAWSIGLALSLVWLWLWWTCGVGHYLRLKRPALIAGVMGLLAGLIALLLVLLTPGLGVRLMLDG